MRYWWLIVLGLVACERPFVETIQPELLVLEPDLSEVQTIPVIQLRVQSAHFRAVGGVLLNGVPMDPAPPGPAFWQISVGLRLGLNTLVLEATDVENISRVDTAYAVYLPHRISLNAPSLPEGRGGHSIVRLRDGDLMVTGGATMQGGPARGESFLLASNSGVFGLMQESLVTPRTGHTSSVLPNGQVLIVGGSRVDSPTNVGELIESVEIFNPDASGRGFREIPVSGQPIRRVYHAAVLRQVGNELFLDLIGGNGDTRYGNSPFFGVRQDLRTFRIEPDELIALNTSRSAPFIDEPVAGYTVTRTQPNSYLLLGSRFINNSAINGNLRIDYPGGTGLFLSGLPEFLLPRTAHATASVLSGVYTTFGGHQSTSSEVLTQMEVFNEQANRFFAMRPSQAMVGRYRHTATPSGLRSVLLVGGFARNGTAITASEYFVVSTE